MIENEGLLKHCRELGAAALERLAALQRRLPSLIAEVRGLGLAIGVELRRNSQKANDEAERVMYGCLSQGLSFKLSDGNVLTLTPPLVIAREQLAEALDILEANIADVHNRTLA